MPGDPTLDGLVIGSASDVTLAKRVRDLETALAAIRRGAVRPTHAGDAVPSAAAPEGATGVSRTGSRFCWFVNGVWRSTPPN